MSAQSVIKIFRAIFLYENKSSFREFLARNGIDILNVLQKSILLGLDDIEEPTLVQIYRVFIFSAVYRHTNKLSNRFFVNKAILDSWDPNMSIIPTS